MSPLLVALRLSLASTVIFGLGWPLLMTAAAHLVAPDAAEGSPVMVGDRLVGAARVGQDWRDPGHLWGRPSAIGAPYDATASSGSNLGPNNPALHEAVAARLAAARAANPDARGPAPLDLLTASGSGLDPDVSPAAAAWQAPRVARARGLPVARVQAVIDAHTAGRWLGVFGEPRVDVLAVNLALDAASEDGQKIP